MAVTVLLVDDSAVIRGLMTKALTTDPMIQIIGAAANGAMAMAMAAETRPNVIVLDIEMPVMDGLTALPQLLKVSPGSKVIMASTLTPRNAEMGIKALQLGAADYLGKPSAKFGNEADQFYRELREKVRALGGMPLPAAELKLVAVPEPAAIPAAPKAPPITLSSVPLNQVGIRALAIASSTGGPQALLSLFAQLQGRLKSIPIFITQHMPPTFTTILADHISKAGGRGCTEAKEGEQVKAGQAYMAPGDYHLIPEKMPNGNVINHIRQDPPENYCRPAADPMFRALSAIYGKHLLALVLTGMGQDGMEGAKAIVRNGGNVIAQDEASCIVYGMPRAVAEHKLCRAVLPLNTIGKFLIENIEGRP